MAEDPSEKINEGKIDLVPMIDCIMLLLLFFILTTKFTAEEKVIASILPTDKGQAPTPQTKPVDPPKMINICLYPEGLVKGFQPSEYQAKLQALRQSQGDILPRAYLRIGGDETILIDGKSLGKKGAPELDKIMDGVRAHINEKLTQRENAGAAARKDQDPVVIHCFSGLSWKFAVLAYDSVRFYEYNKSGQKMGNDPKEWANNREITFAPPRIRNYSAKELGEELYEVVNMQ